MLRGSSLTRVQATDIFRGFHLDLLTGEGLYHVEFQGALENAQNWFVGSTDIKNAFHQMLVPGWLQAFFALPAVLDPMLVTVIGDSFTRI